MNSLGHFLTEKKFRCVICNYAVPMYYLRPIMPLIFSAEKVFGVLCLISKDILAYIISFIYFISIFILLTRRKATEELIHRVGNYPDLLPEIPRYCCPLVI